MNNMSETDNELYDILKNGINKDMSDDEVMRVIKYVMKTLPTYNKIKGTSNAIEMILKMFSLSCKIINLWHTTKREENGKDLIHSKAFVEEIAIDDFTEYYLTSRFNVEVYFSELSFVEFTKNVNLFVRLIDSVKPVTRILNQISYVVDELRECYFCDCKQIIADELQEETITFTDSRRGTVTPFRNMNDNTCYVPAIDTDDNSVYGLLTNLADAPYKNFELLGGNELTLQNITVDIDGVSKTLIEACTEVKAEYMSYVLNLPGILSKETKITVTSDKAAKMKFNIMEGGIKISIGDTDGMADIATALDNINIRCTIIPTLTKIFKDSYNTNNVVVACTDIANPSYMKLKVKHIENTYSFGAV